MAAEMKKKCYKQPEAKELRRYRLTLKQNVHQPSRESRGWDLQAGQRHVSENV